MIHLDDGAPCAARVEVSIQLAARFGGTLTGVYLVPTPELTPTVAALLPADSVARRVAASGDAQDRSGNAFRHAAGGRVVDVEWRAPAGAPVEAAVASARCADLAVLGQPQADGDQRGFEQRIAEGVLLGSGAPVLYVPYTGVPSTLGTRVLVAWDGGREAARALRDALPFLASAEEVQVASYPRDAERAEMLARLQPHLESYLALHRVKVSFRGHLGDDLTVGERLLSLAADAGSDLLVMGGFAHSRAREWVLGGVTRTMLESMTLPVLMSR
ncbi:MAG: universal stress protein [Casimicrobiaceae bacterium]